jgi:hypothetical protein
VVSVVLLLSDTNSRSWSAGGISRITVKRHEQSFFVRWWTVRVA